MVEMNVGTSGAQRNWQDAGNISIKHHGGVRKGSGAEITDKLIQSDSSSFREPEVPPVDYPQLSDYNPNAKNTPNGSAKPSPASRFGSNLEHNIKNMSNAQLAQLKGAHPNLTPAQARQMLIFAFNHPGSNVDPAVKQVLQQLVDQASSDTRQELGLSNDWKPPQPDSKAANQKTSQTYSNNFAQLANKKESPQNANALILAFNNPEYAKDLSPSLKNELSTLTQQAAAKTKDETGAPDGFKMQPDTEGFQAQVGKSYFSAFMAELSNQASAMGLTPKEAAEMETLHFAPEADVPDKEKLSAFLPKLNQKAMSTVKKQFQLPDKFPMKANTDSYKGMLLQNYQDQFAKGLDNVNPPLSSSQKQALLQTKGMNGNGLPNDLKVIFNTLKDKTASDIQDMFGLPKDWDPKTNKLQENEESGSVSEEEGATESAGSTEEAWNGVAGPAGGGPNKRVNSSRLKAQTVNIGEVNLAPRDHQLANNVFNHFSEGVSHLNTFINTYLPGSDAMKLGDEMLIVSLALSHLRQQNYDTQANQAKASSVTADAQKDTQIGKIERQHKQFEDAHKPEKECILYKILDCIPGLGQLIEAYIKFQIWQLDLITGGAISMICKSCGMQSLAENPLEMMGMINKEQADKMDFALQIIGMVVEMALSILTANPALLMGEISMMTANIAKTAVTTAVKAALPEVVKAVAQGATKEAVKEIAKDVLIKEASKVFEEALKAGASKAAVEAAQESFNKILPKLVERVVQDAVKEVAKEATQEVIQQQLSQDMKILVKEAAQEAAKEAVKAAAKEGGKEGAKETVKETAKDVTDASAKSASQLSKFAKNVLEIAKDNLDRLKSLVSAEKGTANELAKEAARGARAALGKSMPGLNDLANFMKVTSLVQGAVGVAKDFVDFANEKHQAELMLEQAMQQAQIEESDTDLKLLDRAMKCLLEGMTNSATHVSDINKQQSQYWQKMAIHYVAA